MTDYDPLGDALDDTTGAITVADMNEAGYDDYETTGSIIDVQTHLVQALDALGGEIFSDPAKWRAVNELVAAMDSMDQLCDMETEIEREELAFTVSIEALEGEA